MNADTLEALPRPVTKAELLERIPPARRALEQTLQWLDRPALVAERGDAWRVIDHVAHIAAWERMLVAHLTAGDDHAVARMTPEAYARTSLDELNARLHELSRDRDAGQILRDFGDAHAAVVALVQRLPDDAMQRPYWDDDPQQRPVIDKLAGDTYLHYLEHNRWIQEAIA